VATSRFLTAHRRGLSLVDCTTFEVMRNLGLTRAFTLDPHFAEQGFEVIPEALPSA
jgi:predicted nucleic acid-binding protein